jgi:hypothetical protein
VGSGKFYWCGHDLGRAEQHWCTNQVCTVDFILKPVHHALLSACVLSKVVVAEAELNNTVHPLYTADEAQ